MTAIYSETKVRDDIIHEVLTKIMTPSQKFWIHRCNSVEKSIAMSEKFPGIEIDATFYMSEAVGRKFDVSHDPKKSVEFPLEDFMLIFADNNIKIWFDFKNLSDANAVDALAELQSLTDKYNIDKNRFIIEGHNLYALKNFHDAGFYTSYYVTVSDAIFYDKAYQQNFDKEIREVVNSEGVDAVSFPSDYYEVVKNADINLDYLTWNAQGERWWNFYIHSDLREILNDPRVKVILVEFATDFDR